MSKHDGMIRAFHWSSRAWYADAAGCEGQIMIGMYDREESGTTGEMRVGWEELGGKVTPCLMAYDDSWSLFTEFADLFESMAKVDGRDISEDVFVDMLLDHGFEDLTQYKHGHERTTNGDHVEFINPKFSE